MRRSGILALVAAAALLGAADDASIWERTVLDVHARDLVLWPGELRQVPMVLRLGEGQPFVVTGARSNCACVKVGGLPERLIPGAETTVTIAFHAGDQAGAMSGAVWLTGTRGGETTNVRCFIDADVRDLARWQDGGGTADLGSHPLGGAVRPPALRLRRGTHPLAWDTARPEIADPEGRWTATARADGDDGFAVELAFDPRGACGVFTAPLRVVLLADGRPRERVLDRRLRVAIDGPLRASPAGALFGAVPAGQSAERSLRLVSAAGATATAVAVDDPTRIRARLATGAAGTQELVLTFTAPAKAGPAPGQVEVAISDGGRLRIPYLAASAPAGGR